MGRQSLFTYGTEDALKINLLPATIHYIEGRPTKNASLDTNKLKGRHGEHAIERAYLKILTCSGVDPSPIQTAVAGHRCKLVVCFKEE
uniref:Uncharacterized protein n=1 Tax=Parascaris equorum TaxID=6256 RepID=A0A914RSY0_PAREQ